MQESVRPDWKAFDPETLRSAIPFMLHADAEGAAK